MAKPYTHAKSSAKRFGGKPEDYLSIHQLLDASKATVPDHRHRCLTHNSWFLSVVLEQVFGVNLTNSDGRVVSVREVGEQHVLEDFNGVIPTAQDYLSAMEYQEWMGAKGTPPSHQKLVKKTVTKRESIDLNNVTFD